ncbi:predicted protein [Histoplasma capsulatum G186AR]|uniref:Uncharacterized protein n=1 Tax=Ajellomyces capsulatus (strain G186AR / H82 / ATCC MYA-2454 / RMSCC 2432) TaxID=447093 RepID=C0ND44_AJECG|nr:uncharacterized protein HCBG_01040 [Histoplasma capsulatum G186AR]EEH11585.1 predicted protein [Histoplasma capsulatum G186AR]
MAMPIPNASQLTSSQTVLSILPLPGFTQTILGDHWLASGPLRLRPTRWLGSLPSLANIPGFCPAEEGNIRLRRMGAPGLGLSKSVRTVRASYGLVDVLYYVYCVLYCTIQLPTVTRITYPGAWSPDESGLVLRS